MKYYCTVPCIISSISFEVIGATYSYMIFRRVSLAYDGNVTQHETINLSIQLLRNAV